MHEEEQTDRHDARYEVLGVSAQKKEGTTMVSLLIVSHSAALARGVKEFTEQITGGLITIGAVGGTESGTIGTSANLVENELRAVLSPDGTLILVDLGSAIMSVEIALERIGETRTIISSAPIVEGTYFAAAEAAAGATLEETAAAAMQAFELNKL